MYRSFVLSILAAVVLARTEPRSQQSMSSRTHLSQQSSSSTSNSSRLSPTTLAPVRTSTPKSSSPASSSMRTTFHTTSRMTPRYPTPTISTNQSDLSSGRNSSRDSAWQFLSTSESRATTSTLSITSMSSSTQLTLTIAAISNRIMNMSTSTDLSNDVPTIASTISSFDQAMQSKSIASASAALADPPYRAANAITEVAFAHAANCTVNCPVVRQNYSIGTHNARPSAGCDPVRKYFDPAQADWAKYDMDNWLQNWIRKNIGAIRDHPAGFSGAFGQWATGQPSFSCRDDGSSSSCDFNACSIGSHGAKSNETRQAYYVMESLNRINSYFRGFSEAFSVAGIGAALAQSGFSQTFYVDDKQIDLVEIKEILNVVSMTCGLIACAVAFAPTAIGVAAGVVATLIQGAVSAVNPLLPVTVDDGPITAAAMGIQIGRIVDQGLMKYSTANDILLSGKPYLDTGDIRKYLANGSFLTFPGVNKNLVTNQASTFLLGQTINALWRIQRVFIIGGGNCGDNQGIGNGPQEAMVCRDGKAWYLYHWHRPIGGLSLDEGTSYGWVEAPSGMDKLGQGSYAGINVTDIINSSLDSYIAAGYNYTSSTAINRARDALTKSFVNPLQQGPGFEGVFTIPVCNISFTIGEDFYLKQYVLQPYGGRPKWCGPICGDGSTDRTRAFIKAANMEGNPWPYQQYCESWPYSMDHKYATNKYGRSGQS